MTCPYCNGRNFAWARRCEHCARPLDPSAPVESAPPVLPDLTLALPESAAVQAREAHRAAIRAALAERGTRVVVTPTLVAANIVIFVIVAFQDPQILAFDADTLLQWGASYGPDVTQGAWWRLITAVFLHGGILHLASNMFVLAIIGPVTERLFGSTAFTVVYALAGIGGVVASEWWHPVSIGVGASGAIFGLYGGLLAFLLRRHTTLPRPVVRSLASGAVVVVLYNIAAGFAQSYIDNAAHLGGLLSGFVAGLALTGSGNASNVTASVWRSVTVACAGLVITAAGLAALPRYGDLLRNLSQFSKLNDVTLDAVRDSLRQLETGALTEDEAATAIERHLPPWHAHRSTLAALQVPASDQALVKGIVQYMAAREYGWTLTADAMRKRDVTLLAQAQAAHAAALGVRTPGIGAYRRPGRGAGSITFGSSALNGELRRTQLLDEASGKLYNDALARARAGRVSPPEVTATIEKDIIVPWTQQYDRLMAIELHGPPDWMRSPVAEFMRRRLDAWRLTARALRERDPQLMNRAAAAHQEALAAMLGVAQEQRAGAGVPPTPRAENAH